MTLTLILWNGTWRLPFCNRLLEVVFRLVVSTRESSRDSGKWASASLIILLMCDGMSTASQLNGFYSRQWFCRHIKWNKSISTRRLNDSGAKEERKKKWKRKERKTFGNRSCSSLRTCMLFDTGNISNTMCNCNGLDVGRWASGRAPINQNKNCHNCVFGWMSALCAVHGGTLHSLFFVCNGLGHGQTIKYIYFIRQPPPPLHCCPFVRCLPFSSLSALVFRLFDFISLRTTEKKPTKC